MFDAVLAPGDVILLLSWKTREAAETFCAGITSGEGARLRHMRVVRNYSMFDRREASQYYPDAEGAETLHT